jgi:hypothetical protein
VKTTIDIPDDLHRQCKARAALEGRSLRDVVVERLADWIAAPVADRADASAAWLDAWLTVGDPEAAAARIPRPDRRQRP